VDIFFSFCFGITSKDAREIPLGLGMRVLKVCVLDLSWDLGKACLWGDGWEPAVELIPFSHLPWALLPRLTS